jgi:hypothetical protein
MPLFYYKLLTNYNSIHCTAFLLLIIFIVDDCFFVYSEICNVVSPGELQLRKSLLTTNIDSDKFIFYILIFLFIGNEYDNFAFFKNLSMI